MSNKKFFDWNKARDEINLRDYFTYKFPNFFLGHDKQFVDNRDPSKRSDKYDFFKKNGVWLYKSRHSGNGGDFIEFIKKEVTKGGRNWQEVINEELEKYYPVEYEVSQRNKYLPVIDFTNTKKDGLGFDLNGKLLPIFKMHLQYLNEFRMLSTKTINSAEFKDTVKTYNATGRKSYCIGIPLLNSSEVMIGLNRIFTFKDSELFNQKKFLPGSDNTTGFSKSNTLKNTEKIILCEGFFDGMAHYEINQPKNVEYIFSNGELGRSKSLEILKYIEERGIKKIDLANDNDLSGQRFNLIILNQLIPNLKLIAANKTAINITIIDGERVIQSKLNEMLSHFLNKNNEIVKTISENNGDEKMLKTSDLFIYSKKKDTNDIEIILPNDKHFIEEFNDFAIEMFSELGTELTISKSQGKDFNDDLKAIKSGELKLNMDISEENSIENQSQINR
ncbi:toprim domain-containing protein [Chryseobacterium sp. LC2016-29]|uniref:toprim domain-containing protein n=1 Tax=Chryseobacterium sp. LC2016-29 TaxID=2897331 RepID=UPI001E509427|nr:toprim domain-containing protein [Chryseobacterium sp. LC2016-29]MCD0480364.1 toprim domain-containing protein [Chryseobacterium sp. LC2016-29]